MNHGRFAKDADEAIALRDDALGEGSSMISLLVGAHALERLRADPGVPSRMTDLHRAASMGDRAECERLLQEGPAGSLHAKDHTNRTALMLAALKGHRSIASLLASYGADLAQCDAIGRTPLHLSVVGDHPNVLFFLLGKGADANARDEDGFSPMHLAINIHGAQAADLIRLLVSEGGADVNITDNRGRTPIMLAVSRGLTPLVSYLADRGADLKAADADLSTPLHEAAHQGHEAIVELLLDRGVPVDHENPNGWTALMEAALGGNPSVVRLLLSWGARPSHQSAGGDSPLLLASRHVARMEHVDMFLDLLFAGADSLAANAAGFTAVATIARVRWNRHAIQDLLTAQIAARVSEVAAGVELLVRPSFLLRALASGREDPPTQRLLTALLDLPRDCVEEEILWRRLQPVHDFCSGMAAADPTFPALRLSPPSVVARAEAAERACRLAAVGAGLTTSAASTGGGLANRGSSGGGQGQSGERGAWVPTSSIINRLHGIRIGGEV